MSCRVASHRVIWPVSGVVLLVWCDVCGVVWNGVLWNGVEWNGVVWLVWCMVWYEMVWCGCCGVEWCGME